MPDNRGGVWWGNTSRPMGSGGLIGFGQSTATPITVTPENAATYGFDKIGAQINPETGGIVNPFDGPADGLGGRAPRNNGNGGPVAPGYSQIMANPQARAFNDRLLNDPQFAQNNLRAGYDNAGATNPYGSGLTFTASGTPNSPATQQTSTAQNPISSTRQVTPPSGSNQQNTNFYGQNNQSITPTPETTTSEGNAVQTTSTPTGTTTAPVLPQFMTQSVSAPRVQMASEEYGPNSQNAVTNAIFRRFNRDYWL